MRSILICFIVAVWFRVNAQVTNDTIPKNVGAVEDAEILITKSRKLSLLPRDRKFYQQDLGFIKKEKPKLEFSKVQPEINLPSYNPTLAKPKITLPKTVETLNNEVKIGFGNYISPLVAVRHNDLVKRGSYGISFFHESFLNGPVRDQSSGDAHYRFGASYNLGLDKSRWSNFLSYERKAYYFYGLSPEAFNLGQGVITGRSNWNNVGLTSRFYSKYEKVGFSIEPRLNFVSNGENGGQNFGNELDLGFEGFVSYDFNKSNRFNLLTEVRYSDYKADFGGSQRTLVSLSPQYQTNISVIKLEIGGQANLIDDEVRSYTQFGLLMGFTLPLDKSWQIKAGLGNEIDQNRLLDLYVNNQYLLDSLSLQTTVVKVPFYAELTGNIVRNLRLSAGARFEDIENAAYFIPSSADSSRFFLRYDEGELSIFEYFGSLTWTPEPTFTISGGLSIFENNATSESAAWYRPTSTFRLSLEKYFDKLSVAAKLEGQDGLVAPTVNEGPIELDPVVNLELKSGYKIKENLSVFLEGKNLLNQEQEYYFRYPSRRLTVKAGISFRF